MAKKLLLIGFMLFIIGIVGITVSALRGAKMRQSVAPARIHTFQDRAVLVAFAADVSLDVTPTYTPWPTNTPTRSPLATITPHAESYVRVAAPTLVSVSTPGPALPMSRHQIEVEWPTQMRLNQTYHVRMLVAQRNPARVHSPMTPGISRAIATIPSASTPQALLAQAEYAGYQPKVTANLVGAAFEIVPSSLREQSLDTSELYWEWNVLPKQVGRHSMDVILIAGWIPSDPKVPAQQLQIWRGQLKVVVSNEPITLGQLSLLGLVTTFVGSALSVPWLLKEAQQRRLNPNSAPANN